jgi:acetolactate decarboxylase
MMKRLIQALAIMCVMMLGFCALAEESATVTVRGIGENVTVTLVMENGKIVSVEAFSDNSEADARGVESLKLTADAMVEKNSVNVEAVSGATGTSNAIIAAATEAWLQIQAEAAKGEDWMQAAPAGDTLYQVALLQSLVQGYYDGIVTVGELKRHGDTGIGTFEGVNGEMIVLDGTVYQAVADGSIATPSEAETVPFSNVTFFDVDETLALSGIADMAALQEAMNGVVNRLGANCFYMVKIEGTFDSIKVRSEYKQEKPYRPLDVALAEDQTEFDYEDIRGTIVGLYCPDYMGDLNSVGWHFHFINEDRTRGGHVLQVSVKEAEAAFDMTDGFEMTLSRDTVFQDMELAKDVDEAIHRAETATTGKN